MQRISLVESYDNLSVIAWLKKLTKNKQEKLVPGEGISIDQNNVISISGERMYDDAISTISTNAVQNRVIAQALEDTVTQTQFESALAGKQPVGNYATTAQLQQGLESKQNLLEAGENISFQGNVISAVDTKYTAGANIEIENGVISATDTIYTAGDNVQINNGVISATDTTYLPGTGISIINGTISVTGSGQSVAWGDIDGQMSNQQDLTNALNAKQDTLEAGDGITIVGNRISAEGEVYTAGSGINITSDNVIQNTAQPDVNKLYVDQGLATKQNTLSATQLEATNSGITQSKVVIYDSAVQTLNGKQDQLSSTQLLAVNSGINTTRVSTYDSYATDIANKQDKLSVAQTQAVDSGITASKVEQYDGYNTRINAKQDILTQGSNISIVDNVISASGGANPFSYITLIPVYRDTGNLVYFPVSISTDTTDTIIWNGYAGRDINNDSALFIGYSFADTVSFINTNKIKDVKIQMHRTNQIGTAYLFSQVQTLQQYKIRISGTNDYNTYFKGQFISTGYGPILTLDLDIFFHDQAQTGGGDYGWTRFSVTTESVGGVWGEITGTLSAQTDLQNALDAKQNNLIAGSNITIADNTITATDTTYSQGTGLVLTGTTFSTELELSTTDVIITES